MSSYETLLRHINPDAPLGLLLLIALMGRHEAQGIYALDATALPVSSHGRRARIVSLWAAWGKDSDGQWFFSFKLHTVCDESGHLVSLRLTPGNVADVTKGEALLGQLRGLVGAYGAYISASLREKLWEAGLVLLTALRKNMKGLASLEQRQQLKDAASSRRCYRCSKSG